ncbi:MAG: gluconeogenesis factor YvcK family protein [Candidatus Roizmanbacteria bacterium]
MSEKKITILGGGTGSFVVLTALKKQGLDLAAVVTMMDSGGSTGRLRDQLGVLPPGDLRQCLVALSKAPKLWRKLFTYRFEKGDLAGHNFGNIMISALQKVSKNYDEVLDELHYLMHCVGRVYPAALSNADIQVTYTSGRVINSEKLLDESNPDEATIVNATAIPSVVANPKATTRILSSDYIIAGPGDLYSSIISVALVDGVSHAVQQSHAKLIYIMNIMTKASQTFKYPASKHISDFIKYFGREPDICIVNTDTVSPAMSALYATHHETQVIDDLTEVNFKGRIVRASLLDTFVHPRSTVESLSATFSHSIVRHDEHKLELCLKDLLK